MVHQVERALDLGLEEEVEAVVALDAGSLIDSDGDSAAGSSLAADYDFVAGSCAAVVAAPCGSLAAAALHRFAAVKRSHSAAPVLHSSEVSARPAVAAAPESLVSAQAVAHSAAATVASSSFSA